LFEGTGTVLFLRRNSKQDLVAGGCVGAATGVSWPTPGASLFDGVGCAAAPAAAGADMDEAGSALALP